MDKGVLLHDFKLQPSRNWCVAYRPIFSYTSDLTDRFLALLAFRLWKIDRRAQQTRLSKGIVMPVLMIVMDAGALYSFTVIAAVVCFAVESNGQYVVLDMVTPIISIAFYMVILRIGIAQRFLHGSTINISTFNATIPRLPLSRGDAGLQAMHVSIEVQQAASHCNQQRMKTEEVDNQRAKFSRV